MKRASIAVAVLAALTLSGCATASEEPTDQPGTISQRSVEEDSSTAEPTESPAPLTAETEDPADVTEPDVADEAFLAYVHAELPPDTSIPNATDEELIAAGHIACGVVEAGTPWEEIRLVEDEEPAQNGYYMDTSAILNGALYNYCPELIPDLESD